MGIVEIMQRSKRNVYEDIAVGFVERRISLVLEYDGVEEFKSLGFVSLVRYV